MHDIEQLLLMTITENKVMHEILEEVTQRSLKIIDYYFGNNKIETMVTFGGSEQCTPPMMHPLGFDEFVVPYEGRLVKRLKEYGVLVSCHCHGKVKHALPCIIDMGHDATDPIERPPAGDVTYDQA